MENGAAGGVKIRNGNGAYVGSNHFKDVPLLTYIYGDLTIEECKLYNTTIFNNVFHETRNIGQQGTGILYYQSFRNGDKLSFSNGDIIESAKGDVQNFTVYKNIFFSGEDSVMTISNRAEDVKDQFYMNGNYYWENGQSVNFNRGNMAIADSAEDVVLTKLNNGFATHSTVKIPLWPSVVDNTQLADKITETEAYLESVKDKVGDKEGQYSPVIADQIKELLERAKEILANPNSKQSEINNVIVDIIELIEKFERDINKDDNMGVMPEDPTVGDGTHKDNMMVTPNLEIEGDKPNTDNTLPNTGDESTIALLGLSAITSAMGAMLMRKKKKDK